MNKKSYFCHESSYIALNASIGYGTKIWHFSHIDDEANIGSNCTIGQNVYIGKSVLVGNNVKIQNNVSVYQGVTLRDYVFCGPSVVFTNDLTPRSTHPIKPNEFKSTLVGFGTSIGANATVLCGIEIGKFAFIGAGSVVLKNVKDHALIVGVPGRIIGWVCECGSRLSDKLYCEKCDYHYFEAKHGLIRT